MKRPSRNAEAVRRLAGGVFLVVAAQTLIGCADLSAITSFAHSSLDPDKGKSFIEDYVNSPTLMKAYEPESQDQTLTEAAAARKKQEPGLTALLKGIQEYMRAVGQLAGDDTVAYDKSFDALSGELKDKHLLKEESAAAVGDIGKTLTKALTGLYRRSRLSEVISEANAPVQKVLKDLQDLLLMDFDRSYANLQTAMGKYFDDTIKEASAGKNQQASVLLVRELRRTRIDDIDARRAALKEYAKALEAIAKGHQLLYDKREDLSAEKVLQEIREYGATITDLYSNVKTLRERK